MGEGEAELCWPAALWARATPHITSPHLRKQYQTTFWAFLRQALKKYNLEHIRPATTPLDTSKPLSARIEGEATAAFRHEYLSKVGTLNYLASKTRPDIASDVSALAGYLQNPGQQHIDQVHHVFAYLAGDSDASILFRANGNRQLTGYVDSDWAGCTDTRKSRTGWVFKLAGGPVS